MEYIEITFRINSKDVAAATAVAEMTAIEGVYVEDYSDMMDCELVRQINLIDEELLKKDRSVALMHLYFEPNTEWKQAAEWIGSRLDAEKIAYEVSCTNVEDSDWLNGWKKYYKPLHFGAVTVVPAWENYTAEPGEKLLILDPGLAFGTGAHETTACCIEALEEHVHPGDRVLDVGCGSGILGIAALICGAEYALGIDIDPYAARAAKENAALNPIAHRFHAVAGNILDEDNDPALQKAVGDAPYDVIVSNIVADVIIALSKQIRRHLRPGGTWIVSGILSDRAAEVKNAVKEAGFSVIEEKRKKEWVCFVLA